MKKRIFLLSLVVGLSVIGTVVIKNFDHKVSGQTGAKSYDENYSFSGLNAKARLVNEVGGMPAINDLVSETFNTFSVVVDSSVKNRISNSENRYKNNLRAGVAEIDVVKAVNALRLNFNTPEFSKTDVYEVRKLRLALQLYAPQLSCRGKSSDLNTLSQVRPTIVPHMSPTEAVFVTLAMIQQKQTNPNYQLTFSERNANWGDLHGKDLGKSQPEDPQKTAQIENAIGAKLQTMSPTELLAVPHRILDFLGIEA